LQGRRENAVAKSSELQDASKTVAPDITGGRRLSGLSPLQNINDRPVRFYRMLVFASSLLASLVPSIHLAEGTMADLDKRTRASLDAVLENACQSLPHGGDHALRKRLHGSF